MGQAARDDLGKGVLAAVRVAGTEEGAERQPRHTGIVEGLAEAVGTLAGVGDRLAVTPLVEAGCFPATVRGLVRGEPTQGVVHGVVELLAAAATRAEIASGRGGIAPSFIA